jgi:outer membrane immunogenic protein
MRRLVLSSLALIACAVPALAADLPAKSVAPAPGFSWAGFYAGLNAGYGWGSVSDTNSSTDLDGALGGGQVGYNWQTGALVLGLEADLQASGQKSSESVTVGGTAYTVDRKLPWFSTARARIGYANGPWLIYATGGAGWGNFKLSVTSGGTTVSDDATKAAWTAGGGVEWMFAPRWSAKVEYLYLDTGTTNVTLFGATFDGRVKDNIVRAGVNYHF